jgi:AraC-like DNA-binding protein
MIAVDYLLTISKRFLENIAAQLSKGCGETVTVANNGLVLPPALGNGRFEFYVVNADLGIGFLDFTLSEEVRFTRMPLTVNHFHSLTFNLSPPVSFLTETPSGMQQVQVGDNWEKRIFYSTSEKGQVWTVPQNGRIILITLHFTRAWLLKEYRMDTLPAEVPYAEDWLNDQALQFGLDLDIGLLVLLHKILYTPAPGYMADLYYLGTAKRLVALVANRLIDRPVSEHKLNYEEVLQLLHIEQALEKKLGQRLPSLGELAMECAMSKSKFEKLFKEIFGKSLTDFFYHLRMQKATELLRLGYNVGKAGEMVGYPNADNFAKMFKNYYKTTPKIYQEKIKEQLKDREA